MGKDLKIKRVRKYVGLSFTPKPKEVKIEVKNCRSCCFAESKYHNEAYQVIRRITEATCLAPGEVHEGHYDITSFYKNYKSPSFCPLKKQSLKIEFKK